MINDKPCITVIIIFLDAEKFLLEALESVFSQSYTNWELLLVDDGSIDNSTRIAKQCSKNHAQKVYYLEHPEHANKGTAASRNLGILHAKGEYIGFLDADDVMLPKKLEEQAEILNRYPQVALVYGPDLYWYSWQVNCDYHEDFMPDVGSVANSIISPPSLNPLFQKGTKLVPGISILVRRSVVVKVGGFEDDFDDLFEDLVFIAKTLLEYPVYVSDKCWYKYRQHDSSMCAQSLKNDKEFETRKYYLEWLNGYLKKNEFNDYHVTKLVSRALWPYKYYTIYRLKTRLSRTIRSSIKQIIPISILRWLRTL